MIAYIITGFLFICTMVLSYLFGKQKARTKHEKELNDALEHEAQKFADIAHTDDDFIRVQQERIDRKRDT